MKKTFQLFLTFSKVEFVRSFFGRNIGLKKHFEFISPLLNPKFLDIPTVLSSLSTSDAKMKREM